MPLTRRIRSLRIQPSGVGSLSAPYLFLAHRGVSTDARPNARSVGESVTRFWALAIRRPYVIETFILWDF
jgi:hypothetical protein